MNKFIGLLSAFTLFIALSCSVNASDETNCCSNSITPQPMQRSTYSRFGQFSRDYYDNYYGNQYVHYKPTYRSIVPSPYDSRLPKNIIKSKDDPVETLDVFGNKPTYTPINKSSYYNQNIPNSAIKNNNSSNTNKPSGTYPWNVKYTYTPASQIRK